MMLEGRRKKERKEGEKERKRKGIEMQHYEESKKINKSIKENKEET